MRSSVSALPYMQNSNDNDNDDKDNDDDDDWMNMIGKPSHYTFSHVFSYHLISSSHCMNITINDNWWHHFSFIRSYLSTILDLFSWIAVSEKKADTHTHTHTLSHTHKHIFIFAPMYVHYTSRIMLAYAPKVSDSSCASTLIKILEEEVVSVSFSFT